MNVGRLATALCLATSIFALTAGAAPATEPAAPAPADAAAPAETVAKADAVDAEALEALTRMSAYLRGLQAFQVRSEQVREVVNDDGQKLQLLGSVTYRLQRPNRFTIEIAEDRQVRQLFYNGATFTLFAPRVGYYASVAAPNTIRGALDALASDYGVNVPLENLFVWGTDADWAHELTSGYRVGYARINGQDADQYAFQEDGVDWQIWIARGDHPVPLRVVMTSIDDPSQPQMEASLTWDLAPQFAAGTFDFTPPADAHPITLTQASN